MRHERERSIAKPWGNHETTAVKEYIEMLEAEVVALREHVQMLSASIDGQDRDEVAERRTRIAARVRGRFAK